MNRRNCVLAYPALEVETYDILVLPTYLVESPVLSSQ